MIFKSPKPVVVRETLLIIAGVVWTAVGIMLMTWADIWLTADKMSEALILGSLGVVIALISWRFGFLRIVASNIKRIERAPIKVSAFYFQASKSYLVMLLMIALGIALRHSSLPKPWLAVIYLGVGGALFLSSLDYYLHYARLLKASKAQSD